MANEEKVALLRQGYEVWNAWREKNPDAEIHLSGADLRQANLHKSNLSAADLSNADLYKVNLSYSRLDGADLRKASLSYARLDSANLFSSNLSFSLAANAIFRSANLQNSDLSNANLTSAKFHEANLQNTNLKNANLCYSYLKGSDLSCANLTSSEFLFSDLRNVNFCQSNLELAKLSEADLSFANLRSANLVKADLISSKLHHADLSYSNLRQASLQCADFAQADLISSILEGADLGSANLSWANLSSANLQGANLIAVSALGTIFKNALLTGACIADWQIGSSTILQEVECKYIFRAINSRGIFTERRPSNNPEEFFKEGEFNQLFQVSQDTVELILRREVNWSAFASSFGEINTKVFDASGQELYLKKYEVLGGGLVRLEVAVPPGSNNQAIHDDLERGYNQQIARLEGEVKARTEMLDQVLRMLKPGDIYMNSSKYEFNQPNIGNFVDTAQSGSRVQSVQHIYAPKQQDLSEAAKEIQALLNTLAETYNTTTDAGKEQLMKEFDKEVEKHPKWRRALKAGGIELIKVLCAPIGVPLEMARVYLEDEE